MDSLNFVFYVYFFLGENSPLTLSLQLFTRTEGNTDHLPQKAAACAHMMHFHPDTQEACDMKLDLLLSR